MSNSDLEIIVNAWVAAQDAEEHSSLHQENEWAIEKSLTGPWLTRSPIWYGNLYWPPILGISRTRIRNDCREPVGRSLSSYGPEYIERIEALAAEDEVFKRLLCGVWRLGMTDDVWNRVQMARVGASTVDS